MTDHALQTQTDTSAAALIALAVNGVNSDKTRQTYTQALGDFLAWVADRGRPPLTRALVQAYKTHLLDQGLAPSSINVKLSAIRRLVTEAADNGIIDQTAAGAITRVSGVTVEGQRLGNWLSLEAAQALVNAPDVTTLKGLRDRALIAVMIGAALRRAEAASLTVEHIQQRDARWVIVDLAGKRGKVRAVPLPAWVKLALDAWCEAAQITSGPIFLALRRGGHIYAAGKPMSATAIWKVITHYAEQLGFKNLAPHDLRRTSAKLMRAGDAPIEQISLVLGHQSIDVTKRYLGTELDLHDAATDRIKLKLG